MILKSAVLAALVAAALCGVAPAQAESKTKEQIKAEVIREAIGYLGPDMRPSNFSELEREMLCALKKGPRKCPVAPHEVPPEVAIVVLAVLLPEARKHYDPNNPELLERWYESEFEKAEDICNRICTVTATNNE